MRLTESLRGIVTVLNTPFTAADTLDEAGLRGNVDDAIAAGVGGFVVPALASEVYALSRGERKRLVALTVEQSAGRVPVIGGAAAEEPGERLAWVERLANLGCDGVLYTPPPLDFAALEAELTEAAARTAGPLILQDWDPAGPGIPVADVLRLVERIEPLQGVKVETVPAGPKYTALLDAAEGALHVSGGWAAAQMIEGLERGIHAFMPTAMHWTYAEVYRRFMRGDGASARELFYRLTPVLAFSNQQLDISIHFFKRLLHRAGVYATAKVRAPQPVFDAVHERLAEEHIAVVLNLEAEVRSERRGD